MPVSVNLTDVQVNYGVWKSAFFNKFSFSPVKFCMIVRNLDMVIGFADVTVSHIQVLCFNKIVIVKLFLFYFCLLRSRIFKTAF